MPVLTPTPIAAMSAWPNTSQTEEDFNAAADAVGVAMPPTVLAMNALAANMLNNAQYVELQATAGLASSNFKGQWSSLTGALNVPASVFHNEMYWQLLANLANVATDQPGVTANWRALPNAAGSTNYIDNGGCMVQQVTGTVLTATAAHSNVDRFLVAALGGTSISGTNGAGVATAFVTGQGVGAAACTFTTGQMQIKYRLESARTKFLNNRTVTMSCRVWHDLGSTRNVTLQLLKCNAADNWGALTSITTSSSTACATSSYTKLSHTFTLGAADATDGLELVLLDGASATVTSKSFLVSEWKLEVGSVATPFQPDNFDDTLRRCQRYYEILGGDSTGSLYVLDGWANYIGHGATQTYGYKVEKFKVPTATVLGTWVLSNVTGGVGVVSAGKGEISVIISATAASSSFSANNNGGGAKISIDGRL